MGWRGRHTQGAQIREMLGIAPESSATERIAVAVLLQAVKDCCKSVVTHTPARRQDGTPSLLPDGTPRLRHLRVYRDIGRDGYIANEARQFLSKPSAMLSFWSGVVALHPDRVNFAYRRVLRHATDETRD